MRGLIAAYCVPSGQTRYYLLLTGASGRFSRSL